MEEKEWISRRIDTLEKWVKKGFKVALKSAEKVQEQV